MTRPPTFRKFVSGVWRTVSYARCKPSTRKRMDSALRTQLLPTFGPRRLDRIDRKAVNAWFDRYSRSAPAGANRTLDVLRQIFHHAMACGHITTNPTRGIHRNRRPKPTRFLSRAEVERLHAALDAHRGRGSGRQQAEIIRLLLWTGCRKGEIVRLRWSEVDGDSLRLNDTKTGPRTVVLNAPARAVLARQPRTRSPYVFPSLTDPSTSRSDELSLWRKVRREAGIADARLHDLRHTFASHAVMRSVPLPVVSRLLGHSQARMTLRYAHVSDKDTEAAAERIGGAMAALLAAPATEGHGASDAPSDDTSGSMPTTLSATSSGASSGLTPGSPAERVTESRKIMNTVDLRRSLGSVLDQLERGGGPVLICRRQTPAAALVSLKDYRERFFDWDAGGTTADGRFDLRS